MTPRKMIGMAAIAVGLSLTSIPASATEDGPNTVAYWCGDEDNAGIKYEPVATPFVVPAPPDGYVWTLLVLKAGSTDIGYGPGNDAPITDPVVGGSYTHSTGKNISHALLCQEPEPTDTTSSTSSTSSTTSTTTTIPVTTTTTICVDCTPGTQVIIPTTTTTPPPPGDDTGGTTTTQPATATTQPGTTTTQPGTPTTTTGPAVTTTTAAPTGLPPTGNGTNLTVIALTLIGIGAVMWRLSAKRG